ncbi:ABC transporter permease [Acidaminobacter sp. JC074]|uniref:ABC transporter permease n=1 Tax=Acidaminobacter sp. JC074 TaxID=2530199 RepID=UPI001F10851B|nr:ABC transporter permease [Acidaminobacter sp. JC074]MCH4890004.1 ABC transporter permease [Acidaminobacter sp. JC074]
MNNNDKIIKKLQKNNIKNNMARTLMIGLAIILTCILLTSVVTITLSLNESFEQTTALQVGSKAHAGFKFLTMEEVGKLKDHRLIKSYGVSTVVGLVTNKETEDMQIEVMTMDDQYMEDAFIDLVGAYPNDYHEIVLDTLVLDRLGLNHELNQLISLTVKTAVGEETEDFLLVGYYEGNLFSPASYLLVSKTYKGLHVLEDEYPDYMGTNNLSVNFASKHNLVSKLMKVTLDNDLEHVKAGPNWAYTDVFQMNLEDVLSYFFLLLVLMTSGYLIIYNIYLIAVHKDIKYYGLLKTIGGTSKQIKRLVYGGALRICLISIPLGLLLGYGFGQLLVPTVLGSLNTEVIKVSTSGWIFVFAGVLTSLTVWISCRKPAKIASKVSPIEAIRTSEVTVNKKARRRKRSKVYQIAWHNVFRVKKKALLVILSLSLSLVIFSSVLIEIKDFDSENFVSRMIGSDYLIADSGYFASSHDGENLSESFLEDIERLGLEMHPFKMNMKTVYIEDDIREVLVSSYNDDNHVSYGHNEAKEGRVTLEAYGVDSYFIDKLKPYLLEGNLKESLKADEIILDNHFFYGADQGIMPYEVGDKIDIEGRAFKVVAIVSNVPMYMYNQYFTGFYLQGYISQEHTSDIISLMLEGQNDLINEVMATYPTLTIKSRQDYLDEADEYIRMFRIVGYSLAGLLAIIGILNYINITATNFIIRRREFAMMQSIGMSDNQFRNMFIAEGLYYIIFALCLTLMITLPLSILMTGQLTVSFIVPLLCCTISLCILVILIAFTNYRNVCKESIIERLQTAE